MNRWAKSGVLDRVFARLQRLPIIRVKSDAVAFDSSIVKVHPEGTGAFKKPGRKPGAALAADGPPRFIWLPRMLERPSRLPCRRARPTMRPKAESCCSASANSRVRFPC
jgi:hypothetical protein